MVDLSHCYLHDLGTEEAAKLSELRARLPEIAKQAREGTEELASVPDGGLTVWGIKIEEQSDASDIVLLKYIRAEELNVDKAANRIAETLIFRADCKIDELAKAELPDYFQGHDYITGVDKAGRPIMISRFGGMDIDKVFGDAEAFVRYRAKLMENAIAKLKFEKGAAEDLCQVHDYSGVIGSMYKSEVKNGVGAVSKVFEAHYPEFKGKTLFVNFPAIFSKPFQALAALLPERTRNKFVILGQNDHETLFEHLSPDLVPEVIGGVSRFGGPLDGPAHFTVIKARDAADIKALELTEAAAIVWEVRVCTMEVSYEVLFTPSGSSEEEVLAKSEAGQYLKAEDGVVSGTWSSKGPGTITIRFKNDAAWFKKRVCVCRAGLA